MVLLEDDDETVVESMMSLRQIHTWSIYCAIVTAVHKICNRESGVRIQLNAFD